MQPCEDHPHSQMGWTRVSCTVTNENQTISSSETSNDNYITFLVSWSLHQLRNDQKEEKPYVLHAALKQNNVSELKTGNCELRLHNSRFT